MADVFRRIRLLALAGLIGFGTLAPAQAASWLEENFYLSGPNYDGVLPPCEAALNKIAWRFERHSCSSQPSAKRPESR